jgi:hypothetical protein
VAGNQNRWQRIAIDIGSVVDDGKRLNAGNSQSHQLLEHFVLALGQLGQRFFNGDYVVTQVCESHCVT